MLHKKVLVYKVDYQGKGTFEDILMNADFQKQIPILNEKISEIQKVHKNSNGTIFGIFVSTQCKNVPPKHKPGDDQYSAVLLENGEGLAYPNSFLYSPETGAIFFETNQSGLKVEKLDNYFMRHDKVANNIIAKLKFYPIVKQEAYKRFSKLKSIFEVEMALANPLGYMDNELNECSLSNVSPIVKDFNVSKKFKLVLKSEKEHSINIFKVKNLIDFFSKFVHNYDTGKRRSTMIVRGTSINGDDKEEEETIDFMLDRIIGEFDLPDKEISTDLRVEERERGLTSAYDSLINQIRETIGVHNNL